VRCMLSLAGHSGEGQPPMFGDFEAQRHWLEVTLRLPIEDWYRSTPQNDLLYWGLDYPPLTAYVSWVFAVFANHVHPPLVAWISSRGIETVESKFFMRCTVIICDMIVFIPATMHAMQSVIEHFMNPATTNTTYQSILQLCILLTPGLLLIDHGHFQYNGVCLGFAIAAAYFLTKPRKDLNSCTLFAVNGNDVMASIFFCLSLNFKQMSLYYSPVFFLALLYKCILYPISANSKFSIVQVWTRKFLNLLIIGMTVIVVFAVLWAPFCLYASRSEIKEVNGESLTCTSSLLHVLSRQFPFSRGLFEDKVSNIWYTISILVDLRFYYDTTTLVRISLAVTLLLLSPVIYYLLRYPIISMQEVVDVQQQRRGQLSIYLALSISAFAFFLCSFQVSTCPAVVLISAIFYSVELL
jgi:alpha-1,3-glucosyltransferase